MEQALSIMLLLNCMLTRTAGIGDSASLTGKTHLTISTGVSFNQPKFCPDASWNPNAITFADVSIVGHLPHGIFINTHNDVFVADRENSRVQVWFNNSSIPTSINTASAISASYPFSLSVATGGEMYVDNGLLNGQVDKWASNGTFLGTSMLTPSSCDGLFVDVAHNIYCCVMNSHQITSKSLLSDADTLTIVAGTGCPGNSSNMLRDPRGIFVHTNLDLYVADSSNSRIQLFHSGQLNGTTIAGTDVTGSMSLNYPTGVALDGEGYLFIVDCYSGRIIGSDSSGFRCLVGCSGIGNASNQLLAPFLLSFDIDGNMFVVDGGNHRIQKFLLSTNSCGK